MKLFGLLLLLCVGSWLLSSAHLTNAAALSCMMPVTPTQVTMMPRPIIYDTGDFDELIGTDCIVSQSIAVCSAVSPLGDGVLVSGALGRSFAWNVSVDIEYQFNTGANSIRLVNLYFYNEPMASSAVGLPNIKLRFSKSVVLPLNYVIIGSEDLDDTDSQDRSISLAITTSLADVLPNDDFTISLTFAGSGVGWVILSEIQLCADPVVYVPVFVDSEPRKISLDTDPVVSTVNLSCTVVNKGSFSWQWSFEGAPFTPQTLSDATRTSTITVSSLSAGSAGRYQCQADTGFGVAVQNILLSLEKVLEPNTSAVYQELGESAVLSCELYGYLESGSSTAISWRFINDPVNSSLIQEQPGTHMIQNGGASPIMSVLSVVTLQNLTSSMFGTYICTSGSLLNTVTLTVGTEPPPPTAPSESPSSSPSSFNIGPIVGGVIAAVVVAIAAVLVIVLVIWLRKKRMGNMQFDQFDADLKDPTTSDPFYAEVNKPQPPPLPDRFYAGAGAYATINTPMDGNGHIELVSMDRSQDMLGPLPPLPDSSPQPVKIDQAPDFLRNNPMYLSADHLNRDESFLQSQRRLGSVSAAVTSSLNMLDIYADPSCISSRQVSPPSDNIPIYSEASLTPAAFRAGFPHGSSPPPDQSEPLHPYASIYANPSPLMKSEGPMELTHENIREQRVLGTGQFGQVILANTVGVSLKNLRLSDVNDDKGITVQVAIKKLKHNPDQFVKEAFEKEIKFMSRLKDENVVRLLAICSSGDPFIVMEYMENGDLNQYLQNREFGSDESQLPASILLYMCLQISSGMRYLASLKFVHRDLATRNCLVGADNVVKVADFGMSRSLYSSYYYRIKGRAMLPIRWMAYECYYGKFSEKTDVWAFGVTMWEMFTFAKKQPYEEMSDQELIDNAVGGSNRLLLSRPDTCPEEVFEVMVRCWVHEPEERADFEEIHSSLSAIFAYSDIP